MPKKSEANKSRGTKIKEDGRYAYLIGSGSSL